MRHIIAIFIKELTDSIRDRRTLFTAVLMPIVLMPVVMIGSFKIQEAQVKSLEQKSAKIGIHSMESVPTLVNFLRSQEKIEIIDVAADVYGDRIEDGTINIYLDVPSTFEENLKSEIPSEIGIVQKSSNVDSSSAVAKVTVALQAFNAKVSVERLDERDVSAAVITVIVPKPVDISTPEERGGFFIGLLLPMFIVIFAIVGGMYIAIDVSAGEKERKTLEALLLTPASRFEIVAGKFLAVAATASTSIILSLFSLYAAFKFFPPNFGGESFVINLAPQAIGVMLIIGVILAIMFSGLLLSVAIFAKSYKEAQNYITPFYLLAVLPVAIFAQLPGFKPTDLYFIIPGVNAVFVIKEVILGTYDMTHIVITIISLLVYAGISMYVAGRIYSKESILFRS
ncbi:MAG: ABC transporter permease [Patescibacteria group bacterium]|jgi:sodium transport system permease protein